MYDFLNYNQIIITKTLTPTPIIYQSFFSQIAVCKRTYTFDIYAVMFIYLYVCATNQSKGIQKSIGKELMDLLGKIHETRRQIFSFLT